MTDLRRRIAQAISDDLDRQDYRNPTPLTDSLSWDWIDQGYVDFGEVADAVLRAMPEADPEQDEAERKP